MTAKSNAVQTKSPIKWIDKFSAWFLMLITPEYKKIQAAQAASKNRKSPRNVPLSIRPEYRRIEGINIRFANGGNPDGETLVLLNPLPQSILAFDPMWEKLIHHFNVFAVDLPGFGRSDGGPEFMTFAAQGDFLKKIIEGYFLSSTGLIKPM